MDYTLMEELRDKLNLSSLSKPVLAGIVVVFVVVAVMAGRLIADAATASEVVVAPADSGTLQEEEEPSPATVFVHVSGLVAAPGLVELPEGSRVADAVQAAGGLAEGADGASVNLARVVADGEQVVVGALAPATSDGDGAVATASTSGVASGKININRATAEELTALPGVGESTASKIVADRKANGPFASPSDLTRVSGIGEKKLQAMIDLIAV